MSGRRDAAERRCHSGTQRTRSRAGVAARQVVVTHGVADVEPMRPDNKSSGGARSSQAMRRSDRVYGESQHDRPTTSRVARLRVWMHDVGAVEPVQPSNK
jgi:hypothetical protein